MGLRMIENIPEKTRSPISTAQMLFEFDHKVDDFEHSAVRVASHPRNEEIRDFHQVSLRNWNVSGRTDSSGTRGRRKIECSTRRVTGEEGEIGPAGVANNDLIVYHCASSFSFSPSMVSCFVYFLACYGLVFLPLCLGLLFSSSILIRNKFLSVDCCFLCFLIDVPSRGLHVLPWAAIMFKKPWWRWRRWWWWY